MKRPKLYVYSACPFCWKVKVALSYKGVDYEQIEVNPMNKKEISFSKDYQKVPIYIDTKGQQVNDSNAIMRHIDEEFPKVRMFETNTAALEEENKWLAWSEKYVQALPPAIYDTFGNSLKAFDYITHTGNFSWMKARMIKYSGAVVMNRVAKKIQKRLAINNPEDHIRRLIREWTDALGAKHFMGGNKPSATDIAVFGISMSVETLPIAKLFKANPSFFHWFTRMNDVTGVKSSLLTNRKLTSQADTPDAEPPSPSV